MEQKHADVITHIQQQRDERGGGSTTTGQIQRTHADFLSSLDTQEGQEVQHLWTRADLVQPQEANKQHGGIKKEKNQSMLLEDGRMRGWMGG